MEHLHFGLLVPLPLIGNVLGKGGAVVQLIREKTGAHVKVFNSGERLLFTVYTLYHYPLSLPYTTPFTACPHTRH